MLDEKEEETGKEERGDNGEVGFEVDPKRYDELEPRSDVVANDDGSASFDKLDIVKLFDGRKYRYAGRFCIRDYKQTIGESGIFNFAPSSIAGSCLLYEEVAPLRFTSLDRLSTWEEEGFTNESESGSTFVIWCPSTASSFPLRPVPELVLDALTIEAFAKKIVHHFWVIRQSVEDRGWLSVILSRSAEERGPFFSLLSPELFCSISQHLDLCIEWESPLLFNLFKSLRRYLAMFCELELSLSTCCVWLLQQVLRRNLESCSPVSVLDALISDRANGALSMPHDIAFRVLMAKTKWEAHVLWMNARLSGNEEMQVQIKKKILMMRK